MPFSAINMLFSSIRTKYIYKIQMFEWWCPIIILHPTRISDQCSHWKSKQMHKLVYFIIKHVLYVTHFVVTLYLFWCCLHCKQQPQCKHRWAIRLFDFVEWNGERGTIQPNQWQVFFKLGMMMLLRLLRVMVLSKTDFYIDKIIEPFLGRDNNSSSCSYQGKNLLNSLQKKTTIYFTKERPENRLLI